MIVRTFNLCFEGEVDKIKLPLQVEGISLNDALEKINKYLNDNGLNKKVEVSSIQMSISGVLR